MGVRPANVLNILLLVVLLAGSAIVFPHLPEHLPMHFGLNGRADGWADRSWLAWLGPVLVLLALQAGLYWIDRFVRRHPQLLNLPNRDRFLALPEDRRGPVYRVIDALFAWVRVMLCVIFSLIQFERYMTTTGHGSGVLPVIGLALSIVAAPLIAVTAIVKIDGIIKRESAAIGRREPR